MINTDASGQGSMVYGKTSDHVLGVRAVLLGGELLETRAMDTALAENIAQESSAIGKVYRTVYPVAKRNGNLFLKSSLN